MMILLSGINNENKTLNPNFFIYVAVRRPLVETLEKPPSKQQRGDY